MQEPTEKQPLRVYFKRWRCTLPEVGVTLHWQCGPVSLCAASLAFLSHLALQLQSVKSIFHTQLCLENYIHFQTSLPVASLKQLLVSFLQCLGVPKPFRCTPDYCCHSCFKHWTASFNVDHISPSLVGQWISHVLVWILPAAFYCRSVMQKSVECAGPYTVHGTPDRTVFHSKVVRGKIII